MSSFATLTLTPVGTLHPELLPRPVLQRRGTVIVLLVEDSTGEVRTYTVNASKLLAALSRHDAEVLQVCP